MATTLNKTLPDLSKLEPLDGNNYKCWSHKLLVFFEQLEVDYVLFNEHPADVVSNTTNVADSSNITATVVADNAAKKKFEKDNKTIRGHLLNHMTNTLFDLCINYKSAKVIWDSLEKKYGADNAGEKKHVIEKWIKFQMVDDKPIMEQVHEYENLTADVLNEVMKMCEILQANVLLENFSPSWSDYMNQLKYTKKNLTLQELTSHMRTEEANCLKVKQKKGQKKGYVKKQNYFNKPEGQIQKSKGPCYVCGKIVHKDFQCNQRQGQSSKKGGKIPPQANLTESGDVITVVIVEANMVANKTDWILDTGASRHLCANKELFHDFEESTDGECVYMGNSTTVGVIGKGKVLLKLTFGKALALNNVLYVPSICRNLVSGALLKKAGLKLIFESNKIVISRGGDFVGKGYLNGGLFVLNIVQEITSNVSTSNSAYIAESIDL
uniref:Retrovirus-related Pol polyprotein from transposon TNT 1-94-like beta-barrel domain-containing protein n=1 Tax=Nicotiana tabacum TaxID=4097 RepID=A0A1S4A453_TOBAC|nr:PREDICTED: uncharacterized protein LOC107793528 [Nicotiana tabacum]